MNRRVEIILERYKDDYPKAMGELNVRKNKLEQRLPTALRLERIAITNELNDIYPLLIAYSKPSQPTKNQ
jgi:hypothetical protein